MNLNNLAPVGGFYRYGLTLYPLDDYALSQYTKIAAMAPTASIPSLVGYVKEKAKFLCGGHTVQCSQVIVLDGLMIFGDGMDAWQVAFSTSPVIYMEWLKAHRGLTHAQYLKAQTS